MLHHQATLPYFWRYRILTGDESCKAPLNNFALCLACAGSPFRGRAFSGYLFKLTASAHLNAGAHLQTTGAHILNAGAHIQTAGAQIQNAGARILNAGAHIQNAGAHIQTTGAHIQNAGAHILNAGACVQITGTHIQNWARYKPRGDRTYTNLLFRIKIIVMEMMAAISNPISS